nr:hypothetical protein [Tanacetum cinerariifolium]
MAFVPGLFHGVGSYYPKGGMRAVPELLEREARAAGVEFRYNTKVKNIVTAGDKVVWVETAAGETLPADAVVSDAAGIGTYVDLLEMTIAGHLRLPGGAGAAAAVLHPLQAAGGGLHGLCTARPARARIGSGWLVSGPPNLAVGPRRGRRAG